jgi:preprotein translocase subunit SecA
VEAQHFEVRKHLLEYDNVANQQRQVIYGLRKNIITGGEFTPVLREFAENVCEDLYDEFVRHLKDDGAFKTEVEKLMGGTLEMSYVRQEDPHSYVTAVRDLLDIRLTERRAELGDHFEGLGRYIFLNVIDSRWREHLLQMDYLRDSVGLMGYGQKDPLIEYKKESFVIFTDMYARIQSEVINAFMHVQLVRTGEIPRHEQRRTQEVRQDDDGPKKQEPVRRGQPKVGRNDPCPCGSGKKYKNCHGTR